MAALGYVLCYAALLALKAWPSMALVYLMIAAQGMLGYGFASLYGAIPAELFQGRHFGAILGLFGALSGIGAGLGPWVTGVVHDLTGSYDGAFALAIAVTLVSVACMWMAAPRRVRLVAGRAAKRAAAPPA